MSSGSERISRRDFIKLVIGGIGGIVGIGVGIPAISYLLDPALRASENGKPVTVAHLKDIPVGTPYPFSFALTSVNGWERTATVLGGFILRGSEDPADIKVLSSRCTHLSCRVNWDEKAQGFVCPCHNAFFDKDGKVISGPPPEPLRQFEFQIDAEGNISIIPVEVKSE